MTHQDLSVGPRLLFLDVIGNLDLDLTGTGGGLNQRPTNRTEDHILVWLNREVLEW
jgi:hypothetical protein